MLKKIMSSIPGIAEYMEEFMSERAIGDDDICLIWPNTNAARNESEISKRR